MTAEPVILINSFEVPEGQEEAFLRFWEASREFLSTQEGYISTRLHRSLAPDAEFRFINVARWQSAQAFMKAISQLESGDAGSLYRAHPALYEVAVDDAEA
jgi:heme oxygenase (mycobilin-producing)